MCTGSTTVMTCNHTLIHYTSYCTSISSKKPCKSPSGPTTRLDDTCATCHPPFQISLINERHDSLRTSLMAKMNRAQTREEVWECKRAIEEAHAQRGRELRDVGKVRWDGVVKWGREGEEGEEAVVCESSSSSSEFFSPF